MNHETNYRSKNKMKYPTANEVVFENSYFKILCFKPNVEGETSTVLLGAIAGHTSQFSVDYKKDQSLAQCAVENTLGGVYSICIKPPTLMSRWVVTYDSWMKWVADTIEFIDNGPVHLAGICQGGALAAKVATKYPDLVCELTVAAAPIDTSFKSVITPAQKIPFIAYQMAVAKFGGVMSGDAMLEAWMKPHKKHHEEAMKDPDNDYFYRVYFETQDIDPIPYLWMIWNVFICNLLLASLNVKCKINTVVGHEDDITPPAQINAIQSACEQVVTQYGVNGGHKYVFGSVEAMKAGGVWAEIFESR
jgi:poly(3-hydroxyalkanoate) synthetase